MPESTNTIGEPPGFVRTDEERASLIDRLVENDGRRPTIDPHSLTWRAIQSAIQQMIDTDYMPALRRKTMDHGDTQYARGGLDALESLLSYARK